jgi:hypothetical protein
MPRIGSVTPSHRFPRSQWGSRAERARPPLSRTITGAICQATLAAEQHAAALEGHHDTCPDRKYWVFDWPGGRAGSWRYPARRVAREWLGRCPLPPGSPGRPPGSSTAPQGCYGDPIGALTCTASPARTPGRCAVHRRPSRPRVHTRRVRRAGARGPNGVQVSRSSRPSGGSIGGEAL